MDIQGYLSKFCQNLFKMDIQGYLSTMKEIQEKLLVFLDNNDNSEDSLQQFINFLTNKLILNEIFEDFLNLISSISMNHKRTTYFIEKIESILTCLKDEIMHKFTNSNLFNIFKENKRILLFLFKNNYIKIDEYVSNCLTSNDDFSYYFTPELILYLTKEEANNSSFEENREKGENENHLCQLIRNDSIKEFTDYINQNNLPINKTKIELSSYETNPFLMRSVKISLIEYTVFYGSIEIVKYLHQNKVDINPSIWLCAVHSNNLELINFLEDNKVIPKDNNYISSYLEAIKCYHNNIAHYIQDKYMKKLEFNDSDLAKLIECYNFEFVSQNLVNEKFFNCFCRKDYISLVNILIKDVDVNKTNKDIY